ncbi:MAG TPA: GNAT family N-acetyltransferase [Flavobacteriales bacterium]
MKTPLLIRPATEADLPGILDIYNELIANSTAVYVYRPQTLETRTQWFRDLKAGGWPVLVSVAGDVVTGFCCIGPFRSKPGYRYTGEHTVHVHAAHRGQGLGRALLTAVVEEAERMGLRVLVGGIDAENPASLALHRALGFTETARMPQVGRKFGRWLDLVFVQRVLPGPENPIEA